MQTYFENCSNIDEIRKRYRDLAKQFHPDLGGDTATMQDINVAYSRACAYFTKKHNPEKSESYYSAQAVVNENIRIIIAKLCKLHGIRIEVCGFWVWVSGNTKAYKEVLWNLGLRWAPKKQMWYYAGIPSQNHKPRSMDYIRSKYGSRVVKDEQTA